MRRVNGRSSIVQQHDAFLEQLLKFHFKTESNNKMCQFVYTSKASCIGSINVCFFHVIASGCFRKRNIVNPLLNQLDLNRSNAISTVS